MKEIPTGVEIIHNHRLNKQIIIEIPKSRFKLHGLLKDNKKWEVSIINPLGACKRNIMENIEPREFRMLIALVLAGKRQTEFKKEPGITKLAATYKSIIKGFKA
jgi:hypothetical protein